MSTESIGDRIKYIRKSLNLNQDIVSKELQITNQTLSRYENGIRSPDSIFLQKFGKLFNVNANWLLYGIGDMFLKDNGQVFGIEIDNYKILQYYLRRIDELFLKMKEEN